MKIYKFKKTHPILIVFLFNLIILMDIPILRQVVGFIILSFFPGFLILWVLKLNKLENTEKFVLSCGLSISFLIFYGLLINTILLSIGFNRPLSTIPLLILFNIVFIFLIIIGCVTNKDSFFSLFHSKISTSEKAFLIIPILFPALSFFGTHIMNWKNNNSILMLMLFLIPVYVSLICFFRDNFSRRLYPFVIFMISISLVIMFGFRSNHIIGVDKLLEYYFFNITLDNFNWSIIGNNVLNSTLSISLLPAIYQTFLNGDEEYLYKILIPILFSITPLVIYLLSNKYLGDLYAFITSFFFMSQNIFFMPDGRTAVAILFVSFAILILFMDNIELFTKKLLLIIFLISTIVSHYSTTYIFFFISLATFLIFKIFLSKFNFRILIDKRIILIFFLIIFFWYSQITGDTFNVGFIFIKNTLINLQNIFLEESRSSPMEKVLGKDFFGNPLSFQIELFFTWLTFLFIGIGFISTIIKYNETIILPKIVKNKLTFLDRKFEIEYILMALTCSILLLITILIPYISVQYDLNRVYNVVIIILAIFFVIGGITISKYLNIQNHIIILIVLVPYFLSVLGPLHNIFGYPRSFILNSEGKLYDLYITHDQEYYGAKWLTNYGNIYTKTESRLINTFDYYGTLKLVSQAKLPPESINDYNLQRHIKLKGYIYLSYLNIVPGVMIYKNGTMINLSKYQDDFIQKNQIYNNSCSKVYT